MFPLKTYSEACKFSALSAPSPLFKMLREITVLCGSLQKKNHQKIQCQGPPFLLIAALKAMSQKEQVKWVILGVELNLKKCWSISTRQRIIFNIRTGFHLELLYLGLKYNPVGAKTQLKPPQNAHSLLSLIKGFFWMTFCFLFVFWP